jgi:dGTPase
MPFRVVRASEWKPPKCYYDDDAELVGWVLEPFVPSDQKRLQEYSAPMEVKHGKSIYKALDTTIMDLADDISYGVHDLEDAIHMQFVTVENGGKRFICDSVGKSSQEWLARFELQDVAESLFGEKWVRKEAIGSLINSFICSVEISELKHFEHPLLKYQETLSNDAKPLLDGLKALIREHVIQSTEVQTLEYRGQQMVMELFQAMASDPERLLPKDTKKTLREDDEGSRMRVISDHIAGMTDDYATRMYERLFAPRAGSLFQKM